MHQHLSNLSVACPSLLASLALLQGHINVSSLSMNRLHSSNDNTVLLVSQPTGKYCDCRRHIGLNPLMGCLN